MQRLNSVVYELGVNLLVRFKEDEDLESLLVEVSPAFVLDVEEVNEILGRIILDFENTFDLNLAFVSPMDGFDFDGADYCQVYGHIQWSEEIASSRAGSIFIEGFSIDGNRLATNTESLLGSESFQILEGMDVEAGEEHFALAA